MINTKNILEKKGIKELTFDVSKNYLSTLNTETLISSYILSCGQDVTVGGTTNQNTAHMLMSFNHKLLTQALIKFLFNGDGNKAIGTKKYCGLFEQSSLELQKKDPQKFIDDNKEVLVTIVKPGDEDRIIREMKQCNIYDDDNLDKITWDLNVIYRMYQERIIDSAKKAFKVIIKIALDSYIPDSLFRIVYSLDYESKTIKFTRPRYQRRTKEGGCKESFRDPISEIQIELVKYLDGLVHKAMDLNIVMTDEEENMLYGYLSYGPYDDLYKVIRPFYNKLTKEHTDRLEEIEKDAIDLHYEEKEKLDAISAENHRYRAQLDDLSICVTQMLDGIEDKHAVNLMRLVSHMKGTGFSKENASRMAISLIPKMYKKYIVDKADIKVCGYPILKDNGLEEGETYTFLAGQSDNGSILDFGKEMAYATGDFRIEVFNGKKYAVKDINIDIAGADFSKRTFILQSKSFNLDDIKIFLKEGENVRVDEVGHIYNNDMLLGNVAYIPKSEEKDKYFDRGNSIEDLLSVSGKVASVSITDLNENDEDDMKNVYIMFSLEDVENVEKECDVVIDESALFNNNIIKDEAAVDEIDESGLNFDDIDKMDDLDLEFDNQMK